MPRNFPSFSIWYCLRRNEHCTTARSVASFHPSISVCPSAATLVRPEASEFMNCDTASVMKPTRIAKTTKPKKICTKYRSRKLFSSGMSLKDAEVMSCTAMNTPSATESCPKTSSAVSELSRYHSTPKMARKKDVTNARSVRGKAPFAAMRFSRP